MDRKIKDQISKCLDRAEQIRFHEDFNEYVSNTLKIAYNFENFQIIGARVKDGILLVEYYDFDYDGHRGKENLSLDWDKFYNAGATYGIIYNEMPTISEKIHNAELEYLKKIQEASKEYFLKMKDIKNEIISK